MGHHRKPTEYYHKSSKTRLEARKNVRVKKKGDLDRKSTRVMRTKMGMNIKK